MAPELSGSVLPRRLADGRLSFDAKIGDRRVKLGEEPEWDHARAKRLLDDVLVPAARLGLPWWEQILAPEALAADGDAVPDFRTAAWEYLHALRRYEKASTRNALASPVVKHLLPFFAYEDSEQTHLRRLDAVTGRLVTDFTIATGRAQHPA